MSEWKTAKQLADELGCSTNAVFTAASKKHRLRGRLIEKQKRGSSAFFRVVPEPSEYSKNVRAVDRIVPGPRSIPKPPLTIVQEEPSGIDQDVWARFEKLEEAQSLNSKKIFNLSKRLQDLGDRNESFVFHEFRLLSETSENHGQRVKNLEERIAMPSKSSNKVTEIEQHYVEFGDVQGYLDSKVKEHVAHMIRATFELPDHGARMDEFEEELKKVARLVYFVEEKINKRLGDLTELVMSLHREVIKTTPAETVGRLGRAIGAFADALKGAK